jgi:hypothetical protein
VVGSAPVVGFAGVLSVGPVGVLLSSDSTPVIKPLALVWGWWWGVAGWNAMEPGSERSCCRLWVVVGGSARCWVLRRHRPGWFGCVLGAASVLVV